MSVVMVRLFAELDAGPEPDELPMWHSGNLGEPPYCWACRQPIPVEGWHVDPVTGGYACEVG